MTLDASSSTASTPSLSRTSCSLSPKAAEIDLKQKTTFAMKASSRHDRKSREPTGLE